MEDLTRVPEDQLVNYNPERYDCFPNGDGTYRLHKLSWWDDASYAVYQGDPYQGD